MGHNTSTGDVGRGGGSSHTLYCRMQGVEVALKRGGWGSKGLIGQLVTFDEGSKIAQGYLIGCGCGLP